MSRADDEYVMRRNHRLEEHIARTSTTHAERRAQPQRFGSRQRSRRREKLGHGTKNRAFDSASTHGTQRCSVLEKGQLLSRRTWSGSMPSHHRRHDDAFTAIELFEHSTKHFDGARGSGHQS